MGLPVATANDIIRRALRLIGATATGEAPSADEAADALSALNAMLAEIPGQLRPVTATEAYQALPGDDMAVVAASAITITLPDDPADGCRVRIADGNGTFATYNVTINRNDRLIAGAAANATLNTNGTVRTYEYRQDQASWIVVPASYVLADEIQLPALLNDALAYMLAFRIAPEFSAGISAVVGAQAPQAERRLKARYMMPSQPVRNEYF
jgi:hypothetical protein